MAVILKGEELERELRGREPLTGSIKLRERDSESEAVYDDFEIEGVLHAGGSCICYKATRFFENSDMAETGTLKEFYPVDSQDNSSLSYNLKRYDIDAGNLAKQLYSEESTLSNFINAQNEFYECYKKISDVKLDNEANDNFFAPIHIYRGIPANNRKDNHTIYIWNPGDSLLKSFDDHLTDMQKRINDEIESPSGNINFLLAQELHTVLQAMKALAIGIQNLHYENLLHLDIKPSNFGVRNLGENNGDNISVSLFDINTIYSRSNPLARTGGTPHFRAPEMIDDVFNNYNNIPVGCQSDVYSLGATLYNAIIIGSGERGLYETDKFSDIDTELSRSLLFEYSEYNSKAEIHDVLVNILKRSLARNVKDYLQGIENYVSVGEFIADISNADELVKRQLTIAREEGNDKKASINVVNKEDYYAEKVDGGAVSAMQCLLYDHPLYDYVDNGKLNVLVLGAGVFGQKFIDIAFELSQIKNCYLDITVISKEKEKDEARYLNSRPEFKNYFYVNGEKPKYDDYGAYGSIRFVDISSSYGEGFSVESKNNIEALENSLGLSDEKFGYVFISLSDEMLNKKLACDLVNSEKFLNNKAIVNFVSYKDLSKEEKTKKEKTKAKEVYRLFDASFDEDVEFATLNNIKLNPVFVKNTLVNHKDFRFLTRMAFNCHLLWGDGLNVDISKSYGKFRASYNYASSFANALSIKYKLHSVGLELADVVCEKDRRAKEEKLRNITVSYRNKIGLGKKENEKTTEQINNLNELTMYEHRRWVSNMICSCSYSVLNDEDFVKLKNTNKDKRNRTHTCIVPSKKEWSLNELEWKDLSNWNDKDIEKTGAFSKLDPLDKMSIKLNRHFMELAKNINVDAVEIDSTIIRRYLYDKPEALAAFNVYLLSLRTLMATIDSVSNHETIKRTAIDIQQELVTRNFNNFKKYLTDDMPNVNDISKRLTRIADTFEPVKIACEFTDYKAKDHILVSNIPFILNFSTSEKICIPFVKNVDDNVWFENVASSIVINPSMVTYLVDVENSKNIISTLKDSLSNITKVMDGHSLQTKIALILYVKIKDELLEEKRKISIENELKGISPRVYSVDIIEIKNQKELVSRLRQTLDTNQKSSSRFSAIEINDEFISGAIYSIEGLTIPTFEFNSMKKSFQTEDYQDSYIWFDDIPFNTHINIEDMFIAHGRLSVYEEPELHKDYKDIWKKCYFGEEPAERYKKAQGWKALCAAIKKKTEKDNLLIDLAIKENCKDKTVLTTMFVPSFCRKSIEKTFEFLSSPKIRMIDDAAIYEHNSSMIKVSFKSTGATRKAFLSLFENPYSLIDDSRINFISNGRFIQIVFDSLIVNDFTWDMVRAELKNEGKLSENESKDSEEFKNAQNAFNYLSNKGYIIKLNNYSGSDKISFCFSSYQIKRLLSNEGQLLELYAYYQTIEKGYFDEIKTGLEVRRKKTDNEYVPTQEFDLVAVKGFKTQIVELKARNNLQQEFYQKLKSNGDRFGINKELILVSDFGRKSIFPENEEFIKRGKEDYGIRTVTDIENVGEQLTSFMKKGSN